MGCFCEEVQFNFCGTFLIGMEVHKSNNTPLPQAPLTQGVPGFALPRRVTKGYSAEKSFPQEEC